MIFFILFKESYHIEKEFKACVILNHGHRKFADGDCKERFNG